MAEENADLCRLLDRAKAQAAEFDWIEAAHTYGEALRLVDAKDAVEIGKIQETAAEAFFEAAMQAENAQEFGSLLSESDKRYSDAMRSYADGGSQAALSWGCRCEAMIAYLGYWKSADVSEKKKNVAEAWSLAKKAMDGFRSTDITECARTYNRLFHCCRLLLEYSLDSELARELHEDAIRSGETLIGPVSEMLDRSVVARASVNVALLYDEFSDEYANVTGVDTLVDSDRKLKEYYRKGASLSKEAAIHAAAIAGRSVMGLFMFASIPLEHQSETASRTQNRLLIGGSEEALAFRDFWAHMSKDDSDDANALLESTLCHVEKGRGEFERTGYVSPSILSTIWFSSPGKPWYFSSRALLETNKERKREMYERSLVDARREVEAAEESGFPRAMLIAEQGVSRTLRALAGLEVDPERRVRILDEAIRYKKAEVEGTVSMTPGDLWNCAKSPFELAELELELCKLSESSDSRLAGFERARVAMRQSLDLWEKMLALPFDQPLINETAFGLVSSVWRRYAKVLLGLHDFTRSDEALLNSVRALERAIELASKSGKPSQVAELLWEVSQIHDGMGDYLKASAGFLDASHSYRDAADKVPRLKDLFEDQVLYMNAWCEIEKARFHHSRQDPASSRGNYQRAAELHASSARWSFLATNYFAWAEIENAEDLSQNDRFTASVEAFRKASELFADSERAMRDHPTALDSPAERRLVERLINATGQRRAFCEARIALEEARLLDVGGNLDAASERYGLVSEQFAKIGKELESENDKKETQSIITLAKAWKAMARAEAESSPELYEEAARLFLEVKEVSSGEKAKALAMGHNRLSLALAAGARYSDSGDSALHEAAVRNLESAAKYYLKAGQPTAVEYVKGSKLLFDGYDYMNRANNEKDEQKKTKLYTAAEKVLQASISSFEKAGQQGRREQVLRILAKVRADRELALALTDVFLAPDVVQTTQAFTSPGSTHESAAGLDRFEHAEIRATLIAKPREVHVGQEFSLEIELVNAGKGPAQLTKAEETVPDGFVVLQEPESCRMEDGHVNLRGRRLNPLGSVDIKLLLKPTIKGHFKFSPRILYLDDTGTYKSCEPAPIEVAVREMGISGWLRGT